MRRETVLLTLALSSAGVSAGPLGGYFEGAPDFGGAKNRLCITPTDGGGASVYIATAYCPLRSSPACYGPRLDGYALQSRQLSRTLVFRPTPACRIKIQLTARGAIVAQIQACADSEHPYFHANGRYTRLKASTGENDCGL
jgi:hypothetical protein